LLRINDEFGLELGRYGASRLWEKRFSLL
jgi:hypothetical protein